MDKIIIKKEDIINDLIKREHINQTRQRIAIYLNLTGVYLKVNRHHKNLLKIDLNESKAEYYDPKRFFNKLFYPAIVNDDDINEVLSYLELIEIEKTKRVLTDFIREPNTPTAANGFIYNIRNNNSKLKEYYIISEV